MRKEERWENMWMCVWSISRCHTHTYAHYHNTPTTLHNTLITYTHHTLQAKTNFSQILLPRSRPRREHLYTHKTYHSQENTKLNSRTTQHTLNTLLNSKLRKTHIFNSSLPRTRPRRKSAWNRGRWCWRQLRWFILLCICHFKSIREWFKWVYVCLCVISCFLSVSCCMWGGLMLT